MRCVPFALAAVPAMAFILAAVPSFAQDAPATAAQQAAPPAETPASDTVALPQLDVETEAAPAKRNKKKQAIKSNATQATAASPAPAATALPGIAVEGEKVVRSFQATTTSIGVVTGQQIREQQIQDLQEALNQTANVTAPEGSRGNAGFTIRGLNSEGLGQNNNPSAAPLISVVIDGATQNPEATRRGARGLWDVEQVEVLRGPQVALQARNSLAGAVFIKTNDPTYKWETIVEGTAGDFDLKSGGFVVNAPIATGQAALRISGQSFQRNHGIRYTDPANEKLDDDDLRAIRGKLLLEPDSIPGLSALFTVARVDDTPGVTSVSAPFFNRVLSFADPTDFVDFRSTLTNNFISDIGYDLGPGMTLRSITAYADTETTIGSAEGSLVVRDGLREGGDFTQDLRLEIDNRGNGLSGVVGLFYGSFKNDIDASDSVFGVPIQDLFTTTDTQSSAAYADLRYRFFDKFVLIGGGRILHDDVSTSNDGIILANVFSALFGGAAPVFAPVQGNFTDDFTEVLPRVGLTYDLTPEQTVGVTYTQGYRNGFTEFRLPLQQFNTVKPEFLDSYELSYRSQWLDRTLSLNGNVFYYDYTDQQVFFDETPGVGGIEFPLTYILNAESSHAYGAELEARWRPIVPLQLYASLGLMRTEFDSFNSPDGNFSGNEFPDAPGYTVAAGGMYKDRSGWFAGANARFTDGYYSGGDLANSPLRFVDGYTTVDVRTGWEWEHYTLTVFAKNVFNEEYVTSIERGADEATVGDERLVGVTMRGRF
jgi:outer membrane receptor protein involved in Fe transport